MQQDIVVTQDVYAPWPHWTATVGDFDLDCTYGTGNTPLEAIVDLLDRLEDMA